jgi:carbon storage regulator
MLVLSRKAGEEIRIGDNIVISVFRARSGSVRLGIQAPREVPIRRQELPVDAREQLRLPEDPMDQ